MSELPPYSTNPTEAGPSPQIINNRVAGAVNTVSIADVQNDYFRVVRESPASYFVALTVDPTPIYRIQLSTDPTDVGDILIFPAFDSSKLAVAAVKLTRNPKKGDPVAQICSASPHLPNASWQPLHRASSLSFGDDYKCSIPIVIIPGQRPTVQSFVWRTSLIQQRQYELWWNGLLPYQHASNQEQIDFRCLFATCVPKPWGAYPDALIQIRRGGGLQFELTVILQMLAIYHHISKKFM